MISLTSQAIILLLLLFQESLPYLVAFTPEGQLLSYNQHQPNVIEVWPQMSDSSFDDVSSIVEVERKLEIEPNTCTVHGYVLIEKIIHDKNLYLLILLLSA